MLIAAGLFRPSDGELVVGGEVLRRPLTDVGIVFQDHLLLEFRSALNNILLQARFAGCRSAGAASEGMEHMGKLGIAHAADRYPRSCRAACGSACRSGR